MDNCRSNGYDKYKKKGNGVVRLIPTTVKQQEKKIGTFKKTVSTKKKSAREIQDEIGIYGAFGRTLLDLHKQGR
ncbi:hypothetical protein [Bacillus sp. FJAT-47783]|uniref:hypothetical protein n=1 Tax=Bacillus sp. FJAT-47783 TaxID=2922712 RepID=UPI001FACE8F1|nr:hypothetical protein [Bacillus sp. FJAT-47783]